MKYDIIVKANKNINNPEDIKIGQVIIIQNKVLLFYNHCLHHINPRVKFNLLIILIKNL